MHFRFSSSTLLGLILGLSLAGYSVLAWTAPVSSPPSGNTQAPLNTGATAQQKTGDLLIGASPLIGYKLSVDGDIVANSTIGFNGLVSLGGIYVGTTSQLVGNVGIGQAWGGNKLEVSGKVKINDGTQGAGKVFTSDGSGVGSWTMLGGGNFDTSLIRPWFNRTVSGNPEIGVGWFLLGQLTPQNAGWLATVRKFTVTAQGSSAVAAECYANVVFASGPAQSTPIVRSPSAPVSNVVDLTSLPSELLRDGISRIDLYGQDTNIGSCCGGGICTLRSDTAYEYLP